MKHEEASGAELAEKLFEGQRAVVQGERVGEILRGDALPARLAGRSRR